MEKINKGISIPMMILLVVGMCMALSGPVFSQTTYPFTVDATTYPVTETAFTAAQIANNAAIEQIWISASSTDTAQTVSIYEYCDSTTTVTLVWRGYIPMGASVNPAFNLQYPLAPAKFYLTNACFRKSSTANSVQFNVSYQ